MASVLVVGGGLAGVRMCEQLRAHGFDGHLRLLGSEEVAPYDRPPLSKQPGADVDLRSAMGLDVFALADDVILGTPARTLVPLAGRRWAVGTDAGMIPADVIVVATGAEPVLPMAWRDAGVRTLRTRTDSHAIWDHLDPGSRMVVIGGGWIGCELAATAVRSGVRVNLVEAGPQVLGELPAMAAVRVAGLLGDLGAKVHLDALVTSVRPAGPELRVAMDLGGRDREVAGDVVVAGLGVRPATRWLSGSVLALTPGGAVMTDSWGRSGAAGVFAVGDAASRHSAMLDRRVAGGHWTEAMQAPVPIAAAVCEWLAAQPAWWGQAPAASPWKGIPYVFSDLGDTRLLVLGDAAGRHPVAGGRVSSVWREGQGWTCFTLSGQRLLGLASTRPRDVVAARRAMGAAQRGAPRVDPEALADPEAPPAAMFPAV